MDMFYLTDMLSEELHELDEQRHFFSSTMESTASDQEMQLQSHGSLQEQNVNYPEDSCEQENNSLPESTDSHLLLSSIATPQPSAAASLNIPLVIPPVTKLSYASIVNSNPSVSTVLRSRQIQPEASASIVPRIPVKTPTNRKQQPLLKPRSSSRSRTKQPKSNKASQPPTNLPCNSTIPAGSSFFSSLLQLGSRPIPPVTPSICTPFSAATLSHLESISPASKLAITEELDAEFNQCDDIDELDASISETAAAEDTDASFHELLTLNLATPSSTKQLTFDALSPYSKEISKIIEEEGDYEDLLSSPVAAEGKYDIPADNSSTPPLIKPHSLSASMIAGVSESDMASIRMAEQLLSPRRSPSSSTVHSRETGSISPLILLSPMSGKAFQLSKSYTPPRASQHQLQERGLNFRAIASSFRGVVQRGFHFLAILAIIVVLVHMLSVASASTSYDSLFSVSDWDTVDFFGVMELSVPQLLRDLFLMESWPGLSMKFASASSHLAHLPVQQRFLS